MPGVDRSQPVSEIFEILDSNTFTYKIGPSSVPFYPDDIANVHLNFNEKRSLLSISHEVTSGTSLGNKRSSKYRQRRSSVPNLGPNPRSLNNFLNGNVYIGEQEKTLQQEEIMNGSNLPSSHNWTFKKKREADFDTNQLSKTNVKHFKDQENRFEGLFSDVISAYGKDKMSHLIENKEFNVDSLMDKKFWKEYPKYFNLNKTELLDDVLVEQNKTMEMFEDLNYKERQDALHDLEKYSSLIESVKRRRSPIRRHLRVDHIPVKKSQGSKLMRRSNLKDFFDDFLGGLGPKMGLVRSRKHLPWPTKKLQDPNPRNNDSQEHSWIAKFTEGRLNDDEYLDGVLLRAKKNVIGRSKRERLLSMVNSPNMYKWNLETTTATKFTSIGNGGLEVQNPSARKKKVGRNKTRGLPTKRDFIKSLKALYEDTFGNHYTLSKRA